MMLRSSLRDQTAVRSIEPVIAAARTGFACMFSESGEYESALIAQRRAEGRYRRSPRAGWIMFAGCTLMVGGLALLLR